MDLPLVDTAAGSGSASPAALRAAPREQLQLVAGGVVLGFEAGLLQVQEAVTLMPCCCCALATELAYCGPSTLPAGDAGAARKA